MDSEYITGLLLDYSIFLIIGGIQTLDPIKNVFTKSAFDLLRHAMFKSKPIR